MSWYILFLFFFFNDTAPTEIYPLSLHDALPISVVPAKYAGPAVAPANTGRPTNRSEEHTSELQSHSFISYAVFCLKKKNNHTLSSAQRANTWWVHSHRNQRGD